MDDKKELVPFVTKAEIRKAGRQRFSLNNTALIVFRDTNENPQGFPITNEISLDMDESKGTVQILQNKRDVGVAYELVEPKIPWSWRKFLNGLDEETLEKAVGEGIICFAIMPIWGSYDHKRAHAAEELTDMQVFCAALTFSDDAPTPIWDFVLTRLDGTAIRLHPSQTHNKVQMQPFEKPLPEDILPLSGWGGSSGEGTYKDILRRTYEEEGRKKSRQEQRQEQRQSRPRWLRNRNRGYRRLQRRGGGGGGRGAMGLARSAELGGG